MTAATTIDVNALLPSSSSGRAQSVPEFYASVIAAVNDHATKLDAISVAGVSLPFIDLRAYLTIGDSTPSVAAANTVAMAAVIAANPSAHWHFPAGTIYFDQSAVSGARNSITISARTDWKLSGEGVGATKLVFQGTGNGGEWRGIDIKNGARRGTVCDLSLDFGTVASPDPGDQMHLLHFTNSAAAGGTGEVDVQRVRFGACIGSGVRILGETGNVVDTVRISYCTFVTSGIGLGSRSCIEVQRGYVNLEISHCSMRGAKNSAFDFEPTSSGTQQYVSIHHCVFDGQDSRVSATVSLGGAGTPSPGFRGRFHDNIVLSGQLTCLSGDLWTIERTTVYLDEIDNAGGHGRTFSGLPLVYLYQVNSDTVLRDMIVVRGSTCSAGMLVQILADVGTSGYPSRVTIDGGLYVQATIAGGLDVTDCTGFAVINSPRIRFTNATPGSQNAIIARAIHVDCTGPIVDGLIVESPNAKISAAVSLSAQGGFSMTAISIRGVHAPGATTNGVVFDISSGAFASGSRFDVYPLVQGCNFTGAVGWVASNSAAGTLYPVISGNQGDVCTLVGTVASPSTLPVVAASGSRYVYQHATAPTFWYKTGTTWTQVTVP